MNHANEQSIEPKTDHCDRLACNMCGRIELITGEVFAVFYGWIIDDTGARCPACSGVE